MCIRGASWVQEQILEANPDRALSVLVVWSHHLPNDSRGAWNPDLLDDPRVTEYWDDPGAAGRWFFDHRAEIGFEFLGGASVWDSSLLFAPDATWETVPLPIEHFGYTVISHADDLKATLDAIWTETG